MVPARLAVWPVLARTAGWPAVRLAAPVMAGLVLVAPALFGPNGMTAADATGAMASSPLLRVGLWSAWLAATGPAARAVFSAPGGLYLRALPVPRWQLVAAHGLLLLPLELPWALLFWRGDGWVAGIAAACAAAGIHASACAAALRPRALAGVAVAGAAIALPAVPPLAALAAGAVAMAIGVPLAFRVAPERTRGGRVRLHGRRPVVALALTFLAAVARTAPGAFGRLLAATAAGAGATVLAIEANAIGSASGRGAVALGILAAALTIGIGGVHGAVATAERAAGWLLASTATPRIARAAATAAAAGAIAAVAGAAHGTAVAIAIGTGAAGGARLAVTSAVWAAALGVLGAAAVRRAEILRPENRAVARAAAGIGIAAIGIAAIWLVGELAAVAGLPLAIVLCLAAAEGQP